ncbi:hypothetical protein G3I60_41000 [Streptomyces sp. SID13666]|uniref:hypothetical protein n=1 Tax=unclassified Streptomyces TaxID=2593676 RepID=UPI0013C2124A|nr:MULTISPECIES: hypothetical protein [unclassified Streptomyces]NEA60377.1 hypothetical protein [Streptomyces sp. SID13666]NEA76761.1 hypothetical protein [Streptomyces sp. SID13588]
MSLTSLLDDPTSSLRRFMDAELPRAARLRAAFRAELPTATRPIRPIRPDPPAGRRPAWTTLGTAVDHRLRCALTGRTPDDGAVAAGIDRATADAALAAPTAAALNTAGYQLLEHLRHLAVLHRLGDRSRPWTGPAAVEEQLARACYAAALFEEVYRCPDPSRTLLFRDAHPGLDLDGLLASVPAYAVADIVAVTAAAGDGLAYVRSIAPDRITLAPTFDGSADVGGADADWIAAGTLIDVKTTITPGRLPVTDIYQLAGYLLLDYHDTYRITHLGWYSARSAALVRWRTADFLALLGARRPLTGLRQDLAGLLGGRPRPPVTPTAGELGPDADTCRTPPQRSQTLTRRNEAIKQRPAMVSWQDTATTPSGRTVHCGQALIHDATRCPVESRLYTRAEIHAVWGDAAHINPPDERVAAWSQRFDLTAKDGMLQALAYLGQQAHYVEDVHGWGTWTLPDLQEACRRLTSWWSFSFDQLTTADRADVVAAIRAMDRVHLAVFDERAMEGA